MDSRKGLLTSAALTGLLIAAGCAHHDGSGDAHVYGKAAEVGQCHGVNACKGTGDCSAATHDCAGENSCEGKGWIKMTQADCEVIKNAKWMPNPDSMKHKG